MVKTSHKALLTAGLGWAAYELWQRSREMQLAGKTVLITGGSRGLGLALAREFAGHGCRIALCARSEAELGQARIDLQAQGAEVFAFPCDITDHGQVEQMVAQAAEHFGQIDILVNDAGIISVGPAQTMTLEDYQEAMKSDFWGAVHCTLAVLPQMQKRQSGNIVNITSIGGKVSVPHLLPYSCAKFAATAFSEGMRAELARDGIVVTTIIPGLLRTGSYDHAFFKGDRGGEYDWFSVSDNLPGLSISAERAARSIVQATRRGEAERTLSLPAIIASKAHGVAPGVISSLMSIVNRALPPPAGEDKATGKETAAEHPSRWRDILTILGRRAQQNMNQL